MVQWQQRYTAARASAEAPKRPDESVQDYQQRQRGAYEALRQLQMAKPTPPAPKGRPMPGKTAQQPSASSGSGGIFSYIGEVLKGATPK